ncbi:IS3/IS911 family transposase [Lysobacter antibioticus]|uniref:SnoaL-like domain protein n=2 Tax=Lysobacter antibioticus TaxID=84531 RepID=A0A0S2DT98_LYSAN|nr:IS3/IS911 family transposase [Lysobacter antibioticus]ALN80733.1 snoaL-like domain protein [Lysobacter antibioticus]
MPLRFLTCFCAAALFALPALAHEGKHTPPANSDVPAAAKPALETVERFSSALQSGDLAQAGSLLANEVLILESGGAEHSREQYLGGHAAHDAAFLKTARVRVLRRTARAEGDLAWVGTENEVHSSADEKPTILLSTETMVLKRTQSGWRIVHVHWSSRPKR